MQEIIQDLTKIETGVVAHGCNCSGGFGSGIAKAIKEAWPEVAERFYEVGASEDLLGKVDFVRVQKNLIIANCYTQLNYGKAKKKYASISAIEKCINTLSKRLNNTKYNLYISKLGCGLGGLDWESEVKPVYEKVFNKYNINVFVCDIGK